MSDIYQKRNGVLEQVNPPQLVERVTALEERIDRIGEGGGGGTVAVSVGSVTALPAGAAPTVKDSGTDGAVILDFGIPAGEKGDKGDPGAALTFEDLTEDQKLALKGEKGDPGPSGSSVTFESLTEEQKLELRGEKGDKGDPGDPGTSATVAAGTVSMTAAGTAPSVTNSGTDTEAVFDFVLPYPEEMPAHASTHEPGGTDRLTAFSGRLNDVYEQMQTVTAASGDVVVDPSLGNCVLITATGATTLNFSDTTSETGYVRTVLLVVNGGANLSFASAIKWAGGEAPILSADGSVDILSLVLMPDGTVYGSVVGLAFA